ncbi:hypothetical protein [Blastopirellula retiformator]|uniref:Uncharacterized protein n=1 Tax=Blastopirellula retiformator TaxID=2527970 RepID=A0A5C5V9T7_9BACT|nr:hypothetical protein [Blastopirellula retiformator]TWT34703.1 hypothetical protein Enr8_21160 [Blastopirellula retiformator]
MSQPTSISEEAARGRNSRRLLRIENQKGFAVDDKLRQLCVDLVRTTLENDQLSLRDRQAAAAFVLKLCEFNLDRTLLLVEIDSLTGGEESPPTTESNKNFFGNDAHETFEPASEKASFADRETSRD